MHTTRSCVGNWACTHTARATGPSQPPTQRDQQSDLTKRPPPVAGLRPGWKEMPPWAGSVPVSPQPLETQRALTGPAEACLECVHATHGRPRLSPDTHAVLLGKFANSPARRQQRVIKSGSNAPAAPRGLGHRIIGTLADGSGAAGWEKGKRTPLWAHQGQGHGLSSCSE